MRWFFLAVAVCLCAAPFSVRADDDDAAAPRPATLAKEPETRHAVASAALCFFAELRSRTMGEIKKQKHYAAIGGVFDKRAMLVLQQVLRQADDGEVQARKVLAKRKPLACSDKETAHRASCYRIAFSGSDEQSDCDKMVPPLDVAYLVVPKLEAPEL